MRTRADGCRTSVFINRYTEAEAVGETENKDGTETETET